MTLGGAVRVAQGELLRGPLSRGATCGDRRHGDNGSDRLESVGTVAVAAETGIALGLLILPLRAVGQC